MKWHIMVTFVVFVVFNAGSVFAGVIPQSTWKLTYVDSQEVAAENGAAVNAFDGNPATFWQTLRTGKRPPPPPHEIRIDLGMDCTVDGFRYLPRQDGNKGRVGKYEFYVSADGAAWGTPVATGTFTNTAAEKEVSFAPTAGRFIRFRALSEVQGRAFIAMAELNALGTVQEGPVALIPHWADVTDAPFELAPPDGVTNPVLTAADVTDVPARFVADPFMFHENDTRHMFFEVYNTATEQGDIGHATSTDGLTWQYRKIVLDEPFHLSNPFVFKYNGTYYMVPESANAREIRLYKAQNFPDGWQYAATLVSGRDYVDSAIIRANDSWWMLSSDTSNRNTYLFYADDPLTGWQEHPKSPVVSSDAAKARTAGRPFVFSGNRIVRPAQQNNISYGEMTRVFEVDILTRTDYAEHEIARSPLLGRSGSGWNRSGMHHLDPWWNGNHWLCSVDGVTGGIWSIGIYRSTDPSAPNGAIDSPANAMTITAGTVVDFAGTGASPAGSLPLSYRWNFGAGSGIPDSTLEDPGSVTFPQPGNYTVTLTVTDADGVADPVPATRLVTVRSTSPVVPTSGWGIIYVDSQELVGQNGAAVNSFDGNPATMWHTQWSGSIAPLPHEIRIDLGREYTVEGFRYLPRQDTAINGNILDYEFYVSSDGNDWGRPAAGGTFPASSYLVLKWPEQEVSFAPRTGRFIRLKALSEMTGFPYTAIAELSVLGTASGNNPPTAVMDNPAGSRTIRVGDSLECAGTGSDPDGNLPLTYRWSFGGSGIPDSTMEDPGPVVFNVPGTYTVTFTVTDALGLSASTTAVITVVVPADLVLSGVTLPATVLPGQQITVPVTVTNQGGSTAGDFDVTLYLSTDSTITSRDRWLGSFYVGSLVAGAVRTSSYTVTMPAVAAGNYYLGVLADPANRVLEADKDNNVVAGPVTVQALLADLAVTALTTPATVVPGQSVTVPVTVQNQGVGPAQNFDVVLYLSVDGTITTGDRWMSSRYVGSMAAGTQQTFDLTFTMPVAAAGNYHFGVLADPANRVAETGKANNSLAQPVVVGTP